MSENPHHCPHVVNPAAAQLKCSYGHDLVHKIYLDDAQSRIRELEAQVAQLGVFINAKFMTATEEGETLNHLRVEQSHGRIQLTLRGKTKLFTPKAIADLIRILKLSYNAANNYSPPAMIHCSNGIENP